MKFPIYFHVILTFGQLQKNVTMCPFRQVAKMIHNESFFFSVWDFFHEHSRLTWQQGKQEGIYFTQLFHFHLPHRHLDISCAITAESSPLHIASCQTQSRNHLLSEHKSPATKLRALQTDHSKITFVQLECYVH